MKSLGVVRNKTYILVRFKQESAEKKMKYQKGGRLLVEVPEKLR
jgi:hypothetical protein